MTTLNWQEVLKELELGNLRAAHKESGKWAVQREIKEAILAAFRAGELKQMGEFVDKHNLPVQKFSPENGVRLVPGGSSVRTGAYVSKSVIIMPPSYINIGAYIDEGTMVDSHVLVGSCAQIGKNVHLSAGVQIGGVLEPIGQHPVIIEDEAFIGAGSVIVEGIKVGKRAVIAPGVCLSKAMPVFDLVNEKELERGSAIPDGAVVVPGSRPSSSHWAKEKGLNLSCALIVKYRDDKSDASLSLEQALR